MPNVEQEIHELVRKVGQKMTAHASEAVTDLGISLTQLLALTAIASGADTAAAVATELQYDKGAMTRLIDKLEERRWVSRQRSRDDRRIVQLALTVEGAEARVLAAERLNKVQRQAMAGLSRDGLRQLSTLLAAFLAGYGIEPNSKT